MERDRGVRVQGRNWVAMETKKKPEQKRKGVETSGGDYRWCMGCSVNVAGRQGSKSEGAKEGEKVQWLILKPLAVGSKMMRSCGDGRAKHNTNNTRLMR